MRFQHKSLSCFGARLHAFAATNPTVPHGPFQGELIFNPVPLHPAPPGLPTTPSGSVDILAIIALHVISAHLELTAVVASVFARLQMGVMIPPSWLVQMMQPSIRPLELDAGPLAAKISNWAHGSLHAGHCMPLAHD